MAHHIKTAEARALVAAKAAAEARAVVAAKDAADAADEALVEATFQHILHYPNHTGCSWHPHHILGNNCPCADGQTTSLNAGMEFQRLVKEKVVKARAERAKAERVAQEQRHIEMDAQKRVAALLLEAKIQQRVKELLETELGNGVYMAKRAQELSGLF